MGDRDTKTGEGNRSTRSPISIGAEGCNCGRNWGRMGTKGPRWEEIEAWIQTLFSPTNSLTSIIWWLSLKWWYCVWLVWVFTTVPGGPHNEWLLKCTRSTQKSLIQQRYSLSGSERRYKTLADTKGYFLPDSSSKVLPNSDAIRLVTTVLDCFHKAAILTNGCSCKCRRKTKPSGVQNGRKSTYWACIGALMKIRDICNCSQAADVCSFIRTNFFSVPIARPSGRVTTFLLRWLRLKPLSHYVRTLIQHKSILFLNTGLAPWMFKVTSRWASISLTQASKKLVTPIES